MILLLLNCLNSLQAGINDTIPLRGSEHRDSTLVAIPINYIKLANIKLVERKYLLKELNIKDSLLILNNNYINIQNKEINKYKLHIDEIYKINNDLNISLDVYKKKIKLYNSIGVGVITGILSFIILK